MAAIENPVEPELVTEVVEPAERARSWDPIDKTLVVRLLVGAAIVALFVTFAIQNAASVEVQLLNWSFEMRRFLVMLLCAVAGVVIWELARAYTRHAKKLRNKARKKM